jgi:GTP-binding protein HflX
MLLARLRAGQVRVELLIPFDRGDVLALVHRECEVTSEETREEGMHVQARMDETTLAKVKDFVKEAE